MGFNIAFLICALFSFAFSSSLSALLPYIHKYDSKGTKIINGTVPIAAEYCLQDALRLVNVLDTITKIYPYEYEELRECEWVDIHQKFELKFGDKYYNSGTIASGTYYSERYNGYDYGYVPETGKTVEDYHAALKDKFYFGIQYMRIWDSEILEKNGITPNYAGVMPIEWKLSGVGKCSQEKYYSYFFSGTYNIRITGKCK